MRLRSLALVLLLAAASPASGTVVLGFEDASPGEVLDQRYSHRGVTLTGLGNGGPFPVIANAACTAAASGVHVMSLRVAQECPEFSEFWGWIEIRFDIPQPRVAIAAIADGASSVIYIKAYDEQGFLDQKIGGAGPEFDGVPQRLEIQRGAQQRWITRVEVSALRSGGRAGFDDLEFDLAPVAVRGSSWSAVKVRF